MSINLKLKQAVKTYKLQKVFSTPAFSFLTIALLSAGIVIELTLLASNPGLNSPSQATPQAHLLSLGGLAVFILLWNAIQKLGLAWIESIEIKKIRHWLSHKLHQASWQQLKAWNVGQLSNLVLNAPHNFIVMRRSVIDLVLSVLSLGIYVYILLLLKTNWWQPAVFATALIIAPLYFLFKKSSAIGLKKIELEEKFTNSFIDDFKLTPLIRSLNIGEKRLSKFYDLIKAWQKSFFKSTIYQDIPGLIFALAPLLFVLAYLSQANPMAANTANNNATSIIVVEGSLLFFILFRLQNRLASLMASLSVLGESLAELDRLVEFSSMPLSPLPTQKKHFAGSTLRISNLSFSYRERIIFSNLSFEIHKGQLSLIAGPNGIGKSTLCQLITGLLMPTQGQFQDAAKSVLMQDYQSIYLDHEAALDQGSLLENLCLGKGFSTEQIESALNLSGILSLVKSLPKGLDTRVSTSHSPFSNGERQRLAFVRALLHRPEIIILDEALSSLAPKDENELILNLKTLAPDSFIIWVSHRPDAYQWADKQLLLSRT